MTKESKNTISTVSLVAGAILAVMAVLGHFDDWLTGHMSVALGATFATKAEFQIINKKLDEQHDLLVSILRAQPREFMGPPDLDRRRH